MVAESRRVLGRLPKRVAVLWEAREAQPEPPPPPPLESRSPPRHKKRGHPYQHWYMGQYQVGAVSPDGRLAAEGTTEGCVAIRHRRDGQVLRYLLAQAECSVGSVAFSLDSTQVCATTSWSASAWDIRDGKLLCRVAGTGHIDSAAFSLDGRHLLIREGREIEVGNCEPDLPAYYGGPRILELFFSARGPDPNPEEPLVGWTANVWAIARRDVFRWGTRDEFFPALYPDELNTSATQDVQEVLMFAAQALPAGWQLRLRGRSDPKGPEGQP